MGEKGPHPRLMPGSGIAGPLKLLGKTDQQKLQHLFGKVIPDETILRLNDALCNLNNKPINPISVGEWKKRNAALKKRIKDCIEPIIIDNIDQEVWGIAQANYGTKASSPWHALNLMQKEIARDEERYAQLKSEGRLYEKTATGQPAHEFCWIDYAHKQTVAIICCENIFLDAGLDTSLTQTRDRDKHADGVSVLTAFEEFCFDCIIEVPVSEVKASTKDTQHERQRSAHHRQV